MKTISALFLLSFIALPGLSVAQTSACAAAANTTNSDRESAGYAAARAWLAEHTEVTDPVEKNALEQCMGSVVQSQTAALFAYICPLTSVSDGDFANDLAVALRPCVPHLSVPNATSSTKLNELAEAAAALIDEE